MWCHLNSLENYFAQKERRLFACSFVLWEEVEKKGNYDERRTNLFDMESGCCKAIDEEVYFSLLGDKAMAYGSMRRQARIVTNTVGGFGLPKGIQCGKPSSGRLGIYFAISAYSRKL